MARKLVLFGGTFDPIHFGHIKPVCSACQQIQADELIFIPCHQPVHKQSPKVTSQDRLNMVSLVAQELNLNSELKVNCSDFEIRQGGQSYTRRTVEYFKQHNPDCDLYFLIGMDSYLNFTTWYKWQEILQFCQLLVVNRPGYQINQDDLPELLVNRSQIIDVEQVDISSTNIRYNNSELTSTQWLPEKVSQYIEKNKLYR